MTQLDLNRFLFGAGGGLVLLLLLCKRNRNFSRTFILARACLLLGSFALVAVALGGLLVVLSVFAPILLLLLLILAMRNRSKKVEVSSVYGTARWAETSELGEWGMFRDGGLPVGLAPKVTLREALRYLNAAPLWASEAACRMALAAIQRQRLPLSIHHGTHAVCFAPAGKGKSSGLVIPFLATCEDSMVVLDVKGELFQETAAYRHRAFGHQIIALDPYGCVTDQPDTLNPLDLLRHSRFPEDDVRAIAEALVVRQGGEERDPHFNDAAEIHVGAITAFVLSAFQDGDLQNVATILANPEALAQARVELRKSTAFGGMLARMGDQLSHFVDKELASTLTTTARHLRFLSTEAIVRSTTTSSFDPRELVTGKMTIYLILPPDRLASLSGLIRLWITSLLRVVVQTGLKQNTNIRFILDEAASLGRLDAIENAITQLRGYGLKMLFMYQSMGQLKKVYSEGQDQTFLSNMDTQLFFGTNDYQTAEYISDRIGSATAMTVSQSGGGNSSVNRDPQGMPSYSSGSNWGYSTQEVEMKLLRPEEVLQLGERTAVVFAANAAPFLTRLVRHYEPEMDLYLYPPRTGAILFASFCFGLLFLALAALGVYGIDRFRDSLPPPLPKPPPVQQPLEEPFWPRPAW